MVGLTTVTPSMRAVDCYQVSLGLRYDIPTNRMNKGETKTVPHTRMEGERKTFPQMRMREENFSMGEKYFAHGREFTCKTSPQMRMGENYFAHGRESKTNVHNQ